MDIKIHYYAIHTSGSGGPWHLASTTLDRRTYCGIVMLGKSPTDERVSLINCPICRRTAGYAYAMQESR
jgi:hypothetical protein